MPKKYIKLYGEMRTCTNYVYRVLKLNFAVTCISNGISWKHGIPRYAKHDGWRKRYPTRELCFVVCMKNPYAWMWSMLKGTGISRKHRFKEAGWNGKADLLTNTALHRGLIKRWNKRHKAWAQMMEREENTTFVRHRGLLTHFKKEMKKVWKTLGLTMKYSKFKNIGAEVLPQEKLSGRSFNVKKEFYVNRKYAKKLPKQVIDIVTNEVDWETLKVFGYKPRKQ